MFKISAAFKIMKESFSSYLFEVESCNIIIEFVIARKLIGCR
jgi:hypothetical protein